MVRRKEFSSPAMRSSENYEENLEAENDLRGIFEKPNVTLWSGAPERSTSSASTTATSPTTVTSPEPPSSVPPSPFDGAESPTNDRHNQNVRREGRENGNWVQKHKIFVGGVPQHVDDNTFNSMFSRFGRVKNSWLQKPRPEVPGAKHRGFGFVVFQDEKVLEHLLGAKNEVHMLVGDGINVEIKRAITKDQMYTSAPRDSGAQEHVQPIQAHSNHAPIRAPTPQSPQVNAAQPRRPQASTPPVPSSTFWTHSTPATPQSAYAAVHQPVVVQFCPMIPSFPMTQPTAGNVESAHMQMPNANTGSYLPAASWQPTEQVLAVPVSNTCVPDESFWSRLSAQERQEQSQALMKNAYSQVYED